MLEAAAKRQFGVDAGSFLARVWSCRGRLSCRTRAVVRARVSLARFEAWRANLVTEVSFAVSAVRLRHEPAAAAGGEAGEMKYLMLFHSSQAPRPEPGTPEFFALFNAYNEADAAMRRAGVLVECAPLEPTTSSTTVRVRDGETLLTDGPAAEIKEQVGGFALIECADLDEAIRWAATIPAARDACVEIRPLVDVEVPS
jgi:hypothetical protein